MGYKEEWAKVQCGFEARRLVCVFEQEQRLKKEAEELQMAIEKKFYVTNFVCSDCGRPLTVSDDAGGKDERDPKKEDDFPKSFHEHKIAVHPCEHCKAPFLALKGALDALGRSASD